MTRRPASRSVPIWLALLWSCCGCAINDHHAADVFDPASAAGSFGELPGSFGELPGTDLLGFGRPEPKQHETGLSSITPYDPVKVPVVLVHGLFSDPSGWDDMLKGLREDPEVESQFQFWTFRYSTGSSYLKSASDLRNSLQDAVAQLDRPDQPSRLGQMVLVGHGLGGLLAKLMVTQSDDNLWNAVASKPIDELDLDAATRESIRDATYFEPQPMIRRVIYIGVPHGGTTWSQHPMGRLGERMSQYPRKLQENYRRILNRNVDELLVDSSAGIPASVEQLSPASALLQATQELALGAQVEFHSIIGNADRLPDGSPGDAVVAVDSAKIPGANSDWYVPARHAELHRVEQTTREVKRILMEHLTKLPQLTAPASAATATQPGPP